MFWIVVDRLNLVLGIGGFALTLVGIAVGLYWQRRRRAKQQVVSAIDGAGLGCATGILIAPVLLFFAFCSPPPGEGLKARDGRARADVIMRALEQYRAHEGAFPDSLRTLVPQWVAASTLIGPGLSHAAGYPFEYVRNDSGFVLTFKYVGPGMNHCSISSIDRSWRCSGYY